MSTRSHCKALRTSSEIFAMEGRIPIARPAGANPPPAPLFSPNMPPVSPLWQGTQLQQHLKSLLESIELLKALTNELNAIALVKGLGEVVRPTYNSENPESVSGSASVLDGVFPDNRKISENLGEDQKSVLQGLVELIGTKNIDLSTHHCMALEAGKAVQLSLQNLLAPFDVLMHQTGRWEERATMVRITDKRLKVKRNRRWRKKRRQLAAETRRKEDERYEKADREADEWRAREIAKDIARRKVEKMKEIAKIKANEEKRRLESELELVLIVEKLQELRSIRIQKLKKQGHFLPEEDDKFLERVRAAVEEEERQAAAAADTSAATNAIANAEESRKGMGTIGTGASKEELSNLIQRQTSKENTIDKGLVVSDKSDDAPGDDKKSQPEGNRSAVHDLFGGLPAEFYHYYHGSNADMGTLIEVRRTWDAFIMPGGSRIPAHWVQPPPPADEIWASYLVQKQDGTRNQPKRKRGDR